MCAMTQMARKRKTLMSLGRIRHCLRWRSAAVCVVASCLAEHTDASIALIEAGGMDRDLCHPYSCRAAGGRTVIVNELQQYLSAAKHDTPPHAERMIVSGSAPGRSG